MWVVVIPSPFPGQYVPVVTISLLSLAGPAYVDVGHLLSFAGPTYPGGGYRLFLIDFHSTK